MKKAWYAKKWITMLLHTAAWVLLFSLPYLLRPQNNPNQPPHPQSQNEVINTIIWFTGDVMLIGFFYLNALLIIPRLFYKKNTPFIHWQFLAVLQLM